MSIFFDSSAYLNSLLNSGRAVASPLTAQEAARLKELTYKDSRKLLYSSIISISDAVSGIQKQRFSWSTVQLYYSTFYSVRSILCDNDVIYFHHSGKPYCLNLKAGETIRKPDRSVGGSTHKWSFFEFERQFPQSPLIAQVIDNQDPFQWMMHKREEANYKRARFIEPNCPDEFTRVASGEIRRFLDAYCQDDTYAFDKDHAILSFPIYCLSYAIRNMSSNSSYTLEDIDLTHTDGYFLDKKGPIGCLIKLKNSIVSG